MKRINRISSLITVLLFSVILSVTAFAAEPYYSFAEEGSGLACYHGGEKVANVYVYAVRTDSGYVSDFSDTNGNVYYFDNNGSGSVYYGEGIVPISVDGINVEFYVRNGKPLFSGKESYTVFNGYLYKISANGSAQKYIKDSSGGTYRFTVGKKCYNVDNSTAKVSSFTGVYGNKYYKNSSLGTATKAYFVNSGSKIWKVGKNGSASVYIKSADKSGTYKIIIGSKCYNAEYTTGKASSFTGIYNKKYYKNSALGKADSAYYIKIGSYIYKVEKNANAAKFIKNAGLSGTYPLIAEGKCYNVSYKTGKASAFTGIYSGKYYVDSAVKKSEKAFYLISGNYVYKIAANGNAAKYIKDASKTGSYKLKIDSLLYSVEYSTAKYKLFTGIYKDQYYKSGVFGSGWYTSSGTKFYFKDGNAYTGWHKISGKYYYFLTAAEGSLKKGALCVNRIVGDYYVDNGGVRVTDSVIMKAVKYANAHSNASQTQEQRLKSCYDYFWNNYYYKRYYGIPTAADIPTYANEMLTNGYGNCYRYASAFAYIARVLGYDVRVSIGQIIGSQPTYAPHGWTEICFDGKWLICDTDMQMYKHNINSFKQTDASWQFKHYSEQKITMSISGGKVTWK